MKYILHVYLYENFCCHHRINSFKSIEPSLFVSISRMAASTSAADSISGEKSPHSFLNSSLLITPSSSAVVVCFCERQSSYW